MDIKAYKTVHRQPNRTKTSTGLQRKSNPKNPGRGKRKKALALHPKVTPLWTMHRGRHILSYLDKYEIDVPATITQEWLTNEVKHFWELFADGAATGELLSVLYSGLDDLKEHDIFWDEIPEETTIYDPEENIDK